MKIELSIIITLVYVVSCFSIIMTGNGLNKALLAVEMQADCVRLFHPAFPDEILQPLSINDICQLQQKKDMLRIHNDMEHKAYLSQMKNEDFLPWKIFPAIGLTETKKSFSSVLLQEIYETIRPYGYIVWSYPIKKPVPSCVLLNNWKQQAVVVTDYSPSIGAKGHYLTVGSSGELKKINWPPLALEIEILEKKWQPVRVSDNIISGEVLQYLPQSMMQSPWELILLLLLSSSGHKEELETFLDTGLSPAKGLISYIRLLKQIRARTGVWDNVPEYLQISENDIYL